MTANACCLEFANSTRISMTLKKLDFSSWVISSLSRNGNLIHKVDSSEGKLD